MSSSQSSCRPLAYTGWHTGWDTFSFCRRGLDAASASGLFDLTATSASGTFGGLGREADAMEAVEVGVGVVDFPRSRSLAALVRRGPTEAVERDALDCWRETGALTEEAR
mmetsp:Transcript_8310/g.18149  ORF Transcript_8310/g.18149 Transcript_8310/m.18149 type:complete len:110 (+) Transcript_8310:962-1291(+)